MAKRNILKLDSSSTVFTVIGISSHENDYRLSWSLNEQLGLELAQTDNLITDNNKEFSCFIHDDGYTLLLIANRCDNGFLLEKYKNFDYLLKFDFQLSDKELSEWLNRLKEVPLIAAVVAIPLDKQVWQKLT